MHMCVYFCEDSFLPALERLVGAKALIDPRTALVHEFADFLTRPFDILNRGLISSSVGKEDSTSAHSQEHCHPKHLHKRLAIAVGHPIERLIPVFLLLVHLIEVVQTPVPVSCCFAVIRSRHALGQTWTSAPVLLDPGRVAHLLLNSRSRAHLVQTYPKVDGFLVPVGGLGDAAAILNGIAMVFCLLQRLKRSAVVRATVQQHAFKRPVIAVEPFLAQDDGREAEHGKRRQEESA
mmetsp:Transcript_81679/g.119691  ORF Transcript_81679/g.119691 Transcript_81679/m.119691 type:complete len:235 (+) Transcript_81679:109-813(+)